MSHSKMLANGSIVSNNFLIFGNLFDGCPFSVVEQCRIVRQTPNLLQHPRDAIVDTYVIPGYASKNLGSKLSKNSMANICTTPSRKRSATDGDEANPLPSPYFWIRASNNLAAAVKKPAWNSSRCIFVSVSFFAVGTFASISLIVSKASSTTKASKGSEG